MKCLLFGLVLITAALAYKPGDWRKYVPGNGLNNKGKDNGRFNTGKGNGNGNKGKNNGNYNTGDYNGNNNIGNNNGNRNGGSYNGNNNRGGTNGNGNGRNNVGPGLNGYGNGNNNVGGFNGNGNGGNNKVSPYEPEEPYYRSKPIPVYTPEPPRISRPSRRPNTRRPYAPEAPRIPGLGGFGSYYRRSQRNYDVGPACTKDYESLRVVEDSHCKVYLRYYVVLSVCPRGEAFAQDVCSCIPVDEVDRDSCTSLVEQFGY